MEEPHGKTTDAEAVMKLRKFFQPDFLKLMTIDRYIIRKFLGTFFFSIILLIFIIIVFDISEHVDDFLKHDAPLKAIIFNYYLNFIPHFINLFSYLFVFIAVIFFTSRMASDSEIVAILSSGISFRRMLLPYVVAASILAVMSFLLGNFVIPYTNRGKLEFEKRYIKDAKPFNDMNIHKQISPGVFLYMENFNTETKKGWKFSLEKFRERDLVYKLSAEEANWDSIRSKWILKRYFSRSIGPMKESMHKGEKLDTAFGMRPADFMEDIEEVSIMNFFTLRKHIQMKKLRGDPDLIKYEVKGYERVAYPFATIILTLIGVAVSSRKVRGGIGFNLGFGLALTFVYILFMQIFTVMATFGNFPALLAVWIPNILFGIIAYILLRIAPK